MIYLEEIKALKIEHYRRKRSVKNPKKICFVNGENEIYFKVFNNKEVIVEIRKEDNICFFKTFSGDSTIFDIKNYLSDFLDKKSEKSYN